MICGLSLVLQESLSNAKRATVQNSDKNLNLQQFKVVQGHWPWCWSKRIYATSNYLL